MVNPRIWGDKHLPTGAGLLPHLLTVAHLRMIQLDQWWDTGNSAGFFRYPCRFRQFRQDLRESELLQLTFTIFYQPSSSKHCIFTCRRDMDVELQWYKKRNQEISRTGSIQTHLQQMGMYQNQSCYIWRDEHPFTSYLGFTRVPRFWFIPRFLG